MSPDITALSPAQYLVTALVFKLAVMALLAIVLVRYHRFRAILLTERRAWPDRLVFSLALGIPMTGLVAVRFLLGYRALDVTLEGTFLAGLIAGPYAGAMVGLMCGLPSTIAGEWGSLPFAVGCGFAGGGLRELCPKPAIWHFSPFVFLSLHRRLWQMLRGLQVDWQIILVLPPIGLEALRLAIGKRFPHGLFFLSPTSVPMTALVIVATVLGVAIPIKIWNSARIEHQLEEQEKLLLAARIEALSSQINPHFLFNALNSIAALIRSNPETARLLVGKLSSLLRHRLKSRDHFVALREEIESIDEYLDIELVRFGDKLRVVKQFAPDTLDAMVPSMVLQPLIENSIKHGVSSLLEGGTITIRSFREVGHTVIEVVDDGAGMNEEQLESALQRGIGLSNVDERLRVTYGANYHLKLESAPGSGTCARMEIPDTALPERIAV